MSEHKDTIKQVEDIIDKGLNSIEMNFDSNIDATNKHLEQLEKNQINQIKKEDHQDMLFLIKLIFVEIVVTIILLLIYN